MHKQVSDAPITPTMHKRINNNPCCHETQDRSCAPIIDCNNGTEKKFMAISVTDFISGTSVWKCLGAFTGSVTNPAVLTANGTISDPETGTFTIETIAIAGGATVAVAGGSIAVVGAGVVAPAVAANSVLINNVATQLASKLKVDRAKVLSALSNNDLTANKIANMDFESRVKKFNQAILEASPGRSPDQLAEIIETVDPNFITDLSKQYEDQVRTQMQNTVQGLIKAKQDPTLLADKIEQRQTERSNKNFWTGKINGVLKAGMLVSKRADIMSKINAKSC